MGRSINPDVFLQVVRHISSERVIQGTLHTYEDASPELRVRRVWAVLGCLAAVVVVATAVSVAPLVNQVTGSPDPGPAFAVIGLLIGGFAFGLFGGVVFAVVWVSEQGVRGPVPLPFLRYGANEHALKSR